MNTKLHASTDTDGRPIRFFMTAAPLWVMRASPAEQRIRDDIGAAALLSDLPKAEWLLGRFHRNCVSAAGLRIAASG